MKIFNKKKVIIISLISIILLGTGSYIYYNSISKEEPLIGAYIDGEYSNTLPTKNSGYVVEKIVCDNSNNATWDEAKWGLKLSNLSGKNKCNIYFETKKPSLTEAITTAMSNNSTMFASDDPDNNVRYIGANPNNYVYFNCSDYSNQSDSTCEKWRIIGIFNNVTKSDGAKENLAKIVRDKSIGEFSFDYSSTGSYTNDWSASTLQQLLNSGAYYNATTGTYYNNSTTATSIDFTTAGLKNDTTKKAIETVVWNLGGSPTIDDVTSSIFYERERGTTVYNGKSTTWTGKIGLMYPSDYGYATSGGTTTNRTTCLAKELFSWNNLNDCYNNDYLFNDNLKWTITPNSNDQSHVFRVYKDNHISHGFALYNDVNIHPSLYLKSNISIKSGNGSENSPYQLNL